MACASALARYFPQPAITFCEKLQHAVLRLFDPSLSDEGRFIPFPDLDAYYSTVRSIHYVAFIAIAVAHGLYVVNLWPWPLWHQWHLRIAEWLEAIAYALVGGLALFVLVASSPYHLLHVRVGVEFATIAGFFFVKGVSHFVGLISGNVMFSSFQMAHLLLISLLLWDLDRSDTFFTSLLYRFSASFYVIGVVLLFHREQLRAETHLSVFDWHVRGTHILAHLALFAAHVMLSDIGSQHDIYLQWFTEQDPTYPVWRVLLFDWIVLLLHLVVFIVSAVLYGVQQCQQQKQRVCPRPSVREQQQRQLQTTLNTTYMKWAVSLLGITAGMILAIVSSHERPHIDVAHLMLLPKAVFCNFTQ